MSPASLTARHGARRGSGTLIRVSPARGRVVRKRVTGHQKRLNTEAEVHSAYGPGSAPAAHGRYALVGQPETLVVCERMETARLLLYGLWEGELEDTLLDDLAYAWGARRPTR